jgi:hypothetical protein
MPEVLPNVPGHTERDAGSGKSIDYCVWGNMLAIKASDSGQAWMIFTR